MAEQRGDEGDEAEGDAELAVAIQKGVVLLEFENHHEEKPGHGGPQRNQ